MGASDSVDQMGPPSAISMLIMDLRGAGDPPPRVVLGTRTFEVTEVGTRWASAEVRDLTLGIVDQVRKEFEETLRAVLDPRDYNEAVEGARKRTAAMRHEAEYLFATYSTPVLTIKREKTDDRPAD